MDYALEIVESASSTQDMVKDLARDGAPEGSAIQALMQTGGRGRHGRVWQSFEGNLFLSLLLRPNVAAKDVGSLALVAGLALYKAIGLDGLALKWPNDLLLHGKKCAGLLLETELKPDGAVDWVVLGLGVNIANAPEEGTAIGGDRDDLRERFLSIFDDHYQDWQCAGFCSMKEDWLARAHDIGAALVVKIGERHVKGAFAGLDDMGNLLLDCDGQKTTIAAGEIYICS